MVEALVKINLGARLFIGREFFDRIQAFKSNLSVSASEYSYSEYWRDHAGVISNNCDGDFVTIGGQSGFYIPTPRNEIRPRIRAMVKSFYEKASIAIDRFLHFSQPHSLSTFVTYEMAYDFIMRRDSCIDYDPHPSRMDTLLLRPLLKSSEELRRKRFLRDRYFHGDHVYWNFYLHSVSAHHLKQGARYYCEIGAGNGNLAALFHHYNNMHCVVIDLPETILLSATYLKSLFPNATLLLPNEVRTLNEEVFEKFVFIFLTPSQIGILPSKAFDICVNLVSMQEMTHSQIAEYFLLIQRIGREQTLFCCAYRMEEVPSLNERPIRALEFPFNSKNEILVDEICRFIRMVKPNDILIRVERIVSGDKEV